MPELLFALYAGRGGRPCCSYLGDEIPPTTCPAHGHGAIHGDNGRHYDRAAAGPDATLGWEDASDE